jgi:hypothetical protein
LPSRTRRPAAVIRIDFHCARAREHAIGARLREAGTCSGRHSQVFTGLSPFNRYRDTPFQYMEPNLAMALAAACVSRRAFSLRFAHRDADLHAVHARVIASTPRRKKRGRTAPERRRPFLRLAQVVVELPCWG